MTLRSPVFVWSILQLVLATSASAGEKEIIAGIEKFFHHTKVTEPEVSVREIQADPVYKRGLVGV